MKANVNSNIEKKKISKEDNRMYIERTEKMTSIIRNRTLKFYYHAMKKK